MAEDELTSKITLDTSDASKNASDFEKRLAAIETAFKNTSNAATKHGESVAGSSKKSAEAVSIFEKMATSLGKVSQNAKISGSALEQVGIEAGAATSKLGGLQEIMEGLGKATPMLLGVGAAVTAIGAAFSFGKDAVEKAAEWQENMSRLGVVVRNQGGDWKKLSTEVKEWAELQERTTAFSRDEAVSAVDKLVAAHIKLGDAQKIVRVAEDAAAATHKSLEEVTGVLMKAEHGRAMGLVAMGVITKDAIKNHMTFGQTLQAIEDRMGGSAQEALDTYSGRMSQLGHIWDSLQEDIGMLLLPALIELAKNMVSLVENTTAGFARMQTALKQWEASHSAIMKAAGALYSGLAFIVEKSIAFIIDYWKKMMQIFGDDLNILEDLLEGKWGKAWKDAESMMGDALNDMFSTFGTWGEEFEAIVITFANTIRKIFADLWHDIATGNISAFLDTAKSAQATMNNAIASAIAGFSGQSSGYGSGIGGGGGGSNADESGVSGINFNPADLDVSDAGNLIGGSSSGRKKAAHHKKGPQHPYDAHIELLVKQIEASAAARKKSVESIHEEYEALEKLLNTEKMSVEERTRIIEVVGRLKQEEAKLSEELTKQAQEHYAKLMAAEQKNYEQFVKHLEEELRAHQITYAGMTAALKEYMSGAHLLTKQTYDEAMQLEEDWTEKQKEEDQKRADNLQKALDEFQKKYDEYYTKLEKSAEEWTDKTAGFIEDLFDNKGKKKVNEFAQAWKQMFKDIEEAALKSVLFQMFMGKNSGESFGDTFQKQIGGLLGSGKGGNPILGILGMVMGMGSQSGEGAPQHAPNSAMGSFLNTFTGRNAASGVSKAASAAQAGSSSGILGTIIGTSAAGQVASSLPTDSLLSLFLGVNAPTISSSIGSSDTTDTATPGTSGTSLGGLGSLLGGSSAGSVLGAIGSIGSIGNNIGGIGKSIGGIGAFLGQPIGSIGGTAMGTIGSDLLGGLGGYLIGSLASPLFSGQNDSSTGGAAGGFAGSALAPILGVSGPIGAIGGALLGTLIGGLFGSHTSPATSPDIYNTQDFGQIETDLTGQAGSFNGTQIAPQSQFMAASGGQSGVSWIEETLAQYADANGNPGPNTPSWLKSQWSSLVGMFGISKTGAGSMQYGHAINNEWVSGPGVTGVTDSSANPQQYTAYGNALDQFYQDYVTQGALGSTNANTNPVYYNGSSANDPNFTQTNPFGAITVNLFVDSASMASLAATGAVSATVTAPYSQIVSMQGVSVNV